MGWKSNCIPRIASGLGGGMGRQGEVCGALTGGVLEVGLIHGRDVPEDQDPKEVAHAKAGEFVERFAAVNGAVRCRDLINLDVSNADGVQEYFSRNLLKEKCSHILSNAVQVVMPLLTNT
jgi:C_GCAxxG_C_C family probable redox protein